MNYTFFDALALPLWIFLIWDAFHSLKCGEKHWKVKVRLAIGIIGLIADFIFVVFRPFG